MVENPVDKWKEIVSKLRVGDVYTYHRGNLGHDAEISPTLRNIQIFVYGLYLMGRVGPRQAHENRMALDVNGERIEAPITLYSFKVLDRIHRLDFDTARKAYLESLATA